MANQPVFSEIGQGYLSPALSWPGTVVIAVRISCCSADDATSEATASLPSLHVDVAKTAATRWVVVYVAIELLRVAPGIPIPVLLLVWLLSS
jgi:ABC-type xylose transport system permease subunit